MSDCSTILESKSSLIPKVEVAHKVDPELSGLEAPDEPESMKGLTLGKPLDAIDEDKDIYSGGGCDDGTDNVDDDDYDDKKPLHTIDDDKDVSGGDSDGGDDAEENSEENLTLEENLDSAGQKFDAAEAIKVA